MATPIQPNLNVDTNEDYDAEVQRALDIAARVPGGNAATDTSDPMNQVILEEQLYKLNDVQKVRQFSKDMEAKIPAEQAVAQAPVVEPEGQAVAEPTPPAPPQPTPQPSKFRIPSPYAPSQTEAVTEFFRRPYEARGLYRPEFATPEMQKQEEKAILSNNVVVRSTTPPELLQKLQDGTIAPQEFGSLAQEGHIATFMDGDDLGTRYRKVLAADATHILIPNKETGAPELFPLGTRREREYYTTEKEAPGGLIGQFAEGARETLLGPGGFGDMAELDKYMEEEFGLSEGARTFYMRQIAEGKYVGTAYSGAARDTAAFFPMIPSYALKGIGFLTADVGLPLFSTMTGVDTSDRQASAKAKVDKWSYEIPSLTETIAEEQGLRPEVVDFVARPRGAFNRGATFLSGELPLAGAQVTYHLGSSFKYLRKYEKGLVDQYGGDNIHEAMQNAFNKGISFNELQENFYSSFVTSRARERAARRLDTAMSMSVALPGQKRKELFADTVTELKARRDVIDRDLAVARQSGDKAAVARQMKRLDDVNKEELAIESAILLPKWLRTYTQDVKEQTIGAVLATEAAYQIFGVDEENLPFVEMAGAMAPMVPQVRDFIGLGQVKAGGVITEALSLWNKTLGDKDNAEYLKASREAKLFLRHVMKQGGPIRDAFITGAEEAAQLRRDLMEISQRTGVDLDPDIFTTSVGAIADMASLQTLARQLRDELQVTNLADIGGNLAQDIDVTNRQQELVTNLSMATRKLLDLQISGALDDYPMVNKFVGGVNEYLTTTERRIATDRQQLQDLMNLQKGQVQLLMKGGIPKKEVDGNLAPVATLSEIFEAENRALFENGFAGGGRTIDVSLEPDLYMTEVAKSFDSLAKQRADMLRRAAHSIRVDEASQGGASSAFASTLATTKTNVTGRADVMYSKLDADFQGARSDVADFFDQLIVEKGVQFDGYIPGEVTRAGLNLAGYGAIPQTNRGMAALFNDAAQSGFDYLNRDDVGYGPEFMAGLLDQAGVEGKGINAWVKLKRVTSNSGNFDDFAGIFDSVDDMIEFSEAMPLPIKPSDWRLVNKHLGRVAFDKQGTERAFTYSNMKNSWGEVSENFQEGWMEGQKIKDVSEDFRKRFKEAQRYYEVNVGDRLDYDPKVRKWSQAVTKTVRDAKDKGEMLTKQGRKLPRNLKPTAWLDEALSPVFKSPVTLEGQALYDNVGEILGKIGGVWDEAAGQYRIVVDGDDEWADTGKALQALLTRHAQGMLARTAGGQHVLSRANQTNKPVYGDIDPLEFNEAQFNSLFNIPVYTRNAQGELVENGTLLNKDDVFDAISIDELTRNREDLAPVIRQGEIAYQARASRLKGELADAQFDVEREVQFMKDARVILGVQGREASSFNIEQVAQGAYTMAMSGGATGSDLNRLKANLRAQAIGRGDDPEIATKFADEFVQRMVVEHIYRKSSSIGGDFITTLPNGETAKMHSIGLDGDSMLELLGREGSEEADRIRTALGDTAYNNLQSIAKVVRRLQDKEFPGIKGRKPSVSLDSVLSRVYNINRQVVSTQWVATELAIRASRNYGGRLVMTMLNDEKVAREILDIIETGKIPEYKREPLWLTSLQREMVRTEMMHDGYLREYGEGTYEYLFGPMAEAEKPEEIAPAPVELAPIDQQMTQFGYQPRRP